MNNGNLLETNNSNKLIIALMMFIFILFISLCFLNYKIDNLEYNRSSDSKIWRKMYKDLYCK